MERIGANFDRLLLTPTLFGHDESKQFVKADAHANKADRVKIGLDFGRVLSNDVNGAERRHGM
jgi:hypothetical protein